jgi:ferritin-like metal-binding protein YciE
MPKNKGTEMDPREELLNMKLQKIYDIELQLVKAIPKMIKQATREDLKRALDAHLKETGNQVSRLEEMFMRMDQKAKKIKSEAIRGHIMDAEMVMKSLKDTDIKDTAIAEEGIGVEKMEIHAYEEIIQIAEELGRSDVVEVAKANMDEEVRAEKMLSEIKGREPEPNT